MSIEKKSQKYLQTNKLKDSVQEKKSYTKTIEQKKMLETLPYNIQIQLGNTCQRNCPHCYIDRTKQFNPKEILLTLAKINYPLSLSLLINSPPLKYISPIINNLVLFKQYHENIPITIVLSLYDVLTIKPFATTADNIYISAPLLSSPKTVNEIINVAKQLKQANNYCKIGVIFLNISIENINSLPNLLNEANTNNKLINDIFIDWKKPLIAEDIQINETISFIEQYKDIANVMSYDSCLLSYISPDIEKPCNHTIFIDSNGEIIDCPYGANRGNLCQQ